MNITPNHIKKITEIARNFGAKKVILFGSALETPEDANDIDIAIDIQSWEIFDFAGRAEEEIGILIDVVPLYPSNRFTRSIERRGKIIYEV